MFKPGDKVTYVTPYRSEIGIVKSISDENHTFVVYHCAGEWDRYMDYTAARTRNEDLMPGWPSDTTKVPALGEMYDYISNKR